MKILKEQTQQGTYVEKISENKYALYIKNNYIGTFPKTVVNIKLRQMGLPEIEEQFIYYIEADIRCLRRKRSNRIISDGSDKDKAVKDFQ